MRIWESISQAETFVYGWDSLSNKLILSVRSAFKQNDFWRYWLLKESSF
jgi:hypothetical protein